jgi:hypothetical protein
MKNIFKRNIEITLAPAKEMRAITDKYFVDEIERTKSKTTAYINEKISPEIACYARCGMSNLSVQLSPTYNKELFISILKKKGYTVDDFGETIEIYW